MSSLLVSVSAVMMLSRQPVRSSVKSVRSPRIVARRTLLGKLHFRAVVQSVDTVIHDGFTYIKPREDGGPLSIDWPWFDHANRDRRIRIHLIDVRARCTDLDSGSRNNDRIL